MFPHHPRSLTQAIFWCLNNMPRELIVLVDIEVRKDLNLNSNGKKLMKIFVYKFGVAGECFQL